MLLDRIQQLVEKTLAIKSPMMSKPLPKQGLNYAPKLLGVGSNA